MNGVLESFKDKNSRGGDGIVIAEVTNINDPDGKGRVKCRPLILDNGVRETEWCFVVTPFGGNDHGIYFHPNEGDLVALAYISGNIHRPIVLGSVWQKENNAPYKPEGEKNEIFSIRTPQHSEMKYTDTEGKEKIEITTPAGAIISEDDGNKLITLADPKSQNMITVNWESGEITLKAAKKIALEVGGNKIQITSEGEILISSAKSVSADSGTITIKSKANTEIGATGELKLDAKAALNAQSAINVGIKGPLVKIN